MFDVQLYFLEVLGVNESVDVIVTPDVQWIVPRIVGTRHGSIRLTVLSVGFALYPAITFYVNGYRYM